MSHADFKGLGHSKVNSHHFLTRMAFQNHKHFVHLQNCNEDILNETSEIGPSTESLFHQNFKKFIKAITKEAHIRKR